jgi:excisionase family DNA binding protein
LGDPGVLHAVAEALAAALAEVLPPEPVAPVAPAQPVGSPADPEALLNTLFPNTLYLSVSDCARLFGLGKPTVYRLVDAGAIPSVTITSRKLVSKATVLELMAHGLPT